MATRPTGLGRVGAVSSRSEGVSGAGPDQTLTEFAHAQMPFTGELGLTVTAGDGGRVEASGAWTAERCTGGGVLHGGYLMALADSVGAMCAVFNLPEGATTSTIESKTNFLRAVRSGYVNAVTKPLHAGRTTIVIDTDLFDDDGKRVARVTQTQAVLRG